MYRKSRMHWCQCFASKCGKDEIAICSGQLRHWLITLNITTYSTVTYIIDFVFVSVCVCGGGGCVGVCGCVGVWGVCVFCFVLFYCCFRFCFCLFFYCICLIVKKETSLLVYSWGTSISILFLFFFFSFFLFSFFLSFFFLSFLFFLSFFLSFFLLLARHFTLLARSYPGM